MDEEKCVRTCASETVLIMLGRIDGTDFRWVLLCKRPGKAPKGVNPRIFWKRLLNKAQPGTFVTIHQLWLMSHERENRGGGGGKKQNKNKTARLDARLTLQVGKFF